MIVADLCEQALGLCDRLVRSLSSCPRDNSERRQRHFAAWNRASKRHLRRLRVARAAYDELHRKALLRNDEFFYLNDDVQALTRVLRHRPVPVAVPRPRIASC